MNAASILCLVLILAKLLTQLWLERLNRRHVLAHAQELPEAFKAMLDEATYGKSVRYTLANGRLRQIELGYDAVVLVAVLFSGALPWALHWFRDTLGGAAWSMAALLFATGLGLSLSGLPLDWYDQFRLEERFGFNTTTQKLWWQDRLKGLGLALALGYPLLWLVLKLVEWMGPAWWLWAWGALLAFNC